MTEHHTPFPWGIHLGDWHQGDDSIPLCVPSRDGGLCCLYDDASEALACNLIENIALKLIEVLPDGAISVDLFDYSHRKRFMHLAALELIDGYRVAYNGNAATTRFNAIEQTALHRHHRLLSFQAPTLSDYNRTSPVPEPYQLLLIHLEHYPDELASLKRLRAFFDAAFDAGYYSILFADKAIAASEAPAIRYLLGRFPTITATDRAFDLGALAEAALGDLLAHPAPLAGDHPFEYLNDNKDRIVQTLLARHQGGDDDTAEDFLSVPIGTTADGRTKVHFSLGERSGNYHALVTGVAGSGKTTLLNTLIVGIAEGYDASQVRLYLMDYKEGVEFQVFHNHPNCEQIYLDNQDFAASVALLEQFVATIAERGEHFRAAAVKDIDHHNAAHPEAALPRLILIIDEVHRLFAGTYREKDHFSALLKQVVRQGRAFGVHVILATQTLTGTEIDRELMSQITLRLSFKLTDPLDAEKVFTVGNTEAVDLDRYQLIYNRNAGARAANQRWRSDPPSDIAGRIAAAIAARPGAQRLTPRIVTSPHPAEPEPATPRPTADPVASPSAVRGDNSAEAELLARLVREGKVKPPPGFESVTDEGQA